MNKTKKLILTLIFIFFIIIIYLFNLLFSINNNIENNNLGNQVTNEKNNSIENEYDMSETESEYDESLSVKLDIDKKLRYENVDTDYFTIEALTSNYINLIGNKDKARLMNILSDNYISEYKINENNIFDILSVPELTDYRESYKVNITEMLNAQINDSIYIYLVKANCRIVGNDKRFSIQVMFEVDTANRIYNTYPAQYIISKGYDKLKAGDTINYNVEEIKENNNNKFSYLKQTDQEIVERYFDNYNELIMYYADEAYKILNTEYSNKRFGNEENFKQYIKDNARTLYLMQLYKYKIVSNGNYTDYICSDKYDNIYIFRKQDGVMRYTVFLDNYTITRKEDVEYYNKLDEYDKAKYHLNNFIKMINTKDFNSIYNVLDNTFKSNNFKNVEELKKYIKANAYEYNEISLEDYEDKIEEYYVFKCNLINMENREKVKEMTIIINQLEGENYTMSFSFNS